jgi:hypothetical protein
MAGVTIEIFLADGTADALRIIEKSNWSGRGLDFARTDRPQVKSREAFDRAGVYVLVGPSDKAPDGIAYVGGADPLRARLDQQFKSKDFWTRAVVFTSKDQNLNRPTSSFWRPD